MAQTNRPPALPLAVVAYALPILAHAYIGHYNRYMADDFCFAGEALNRGVFGAISFTYLTSNGRVAFVLLDSLAAVSGPWLAPLMPGLLLAAWLGALGWALAQLPLANSSRANRLAAALLAIVIVGVTVAAVPNPAQSLYWIGGLLTYALPLVLGSLLAGLVFRYVRRPAGWRGPLLVAAVALFAGLFSEIYSALQAAALGLALAGLLAWSLSRRAGSRARAPTVVLLAGFAGSVLALLIIGLAPGTRLRRDTFPAPPGLGALIWNSIQYSLWFLRDAVSQHWPLLLAVTALAAAGALALDGPLARPRSRALLAAALIALPVLTFELLTAAYAPAFYAVLYLPPERVLVIQWFLLGVAAAAWGFAAGAALRPAVGSAVRKWSVPLPAQALLAVLFIAILAAPGLAAAAQTFSGRAAARDFASTFDSYDRQLRAAKAAGASRYELARLENPGGIENFSNDPQHWSNHCAFLYYGLEVSAFAPPPLPTPAELAQRQPLQAEIGGVAQVRGYTLSQSQVRAGETLTITVYWRPLANTDVPYTVFLHLYDAATNTSLAQADRYPGQGQYPTTLWIHGRDFADTYTLTVRPDAPPANASLILGLYDLATNQRLPVSGPDASPSGADWVQFGQVQVRR